MAALPPAVRVPLEHQVELARRGPCILIGDGHCCVGQRRSLTRLTEWPTKLLQQTWPANAIDKMEVCKKSSTPILQTDSAGFFDHAFTDAPHKISEGVRAWTTGTIHRAARGVETPEISSLLPAAPIVAKHPGVLIIMLSRRTIFYGRSKFDNFTIRKLCFI